MRFNGKLQPNFWNSEDSCRKHVFFPFCFGNLCFTSIEHVMLTKKVIQQHHLMENAKVKVPTVHPSPSRPPRSPRRRMPPRQVSLWQQQRRRPSDRRRRNLCKISPICQAIYGVHIWGRKEGRKQLEIWMFCVDIKGVKSYQRNVLKKEN